MATISSTLQLTFFSSRPTNSSSSSSVRSTAYFSNLNSKFLGSPRTKTLGWCRLTTRLGPSSGSRTTCWFRFGKNGVDAVGAGIYGSQTRDDFDRDDVEQQESTPLAPEMIQEPIFSNSSSFYNTGNTELGSGCPCLFCSGTNLLLSYIGLLGVVCSCHGFYMSISKFSEGYDRYGDFSADLRPREKRGAS